MISKGQIRAEIKELFEKMSAEDKALKSRKLAENLKSFLVSLRQTFPAIPEHFLIGAFAPLTDEVEWMFKPGEYTGRLAFPVWENEAMSFRRADYENLQVKKAFGVEMKTPTDEAEEVTPKLLLIPGRAFTRDGKRVGRGKGYYDRYLENNQAIKIGLCFEEQLVSQLPTEKYDINMDLILTEKQIYGELTLVEERWI